MFCLDLEERFRLANNMDREPLAPTWEDSSTKDRFVCEMLGDRSRGDEGSRFAVGE